jgi:hypothetical protein
VACPYNGILFTYENGILYTYENGILFTYEINEILMNATP